LTVDIKLNVSDVKVLQEELLKWYQVHKRDLPWRKNTDPYRVWVSEIMLQQTRVDTVIPYYERFMKQFPTLQDLAQAPEEQVLKAWEGLGYYSRARNLHTAVKEVAEKYNGKVPDEPKEISKLKGIGPYTAGAILSIAYKRKLPAVDGNVMRVFSRLFALKDDIAKVTTRKKMEAIADKIIPEDSPGDFNQALMELGATICTPVGPQCLFCPVQTVCNAYKQGIQEELPYKKRAKPPLQMPVLFLWVTCGTQFLIEKRAEQGLLQGMWALPTLENVAEDQVDPYLQQICKEWGFIIRDMKRIGNLEHIFSHRHWKITLITIDLQEKPETLLSNWKWIHQDQIKEFAFPTAYRKAIDMLF
jgi:A/G-specific adenine glycosylase